VAVGVMKSVGLPLAVGVKKRPSDKSRHGALQIMSLAPIYNVNGIGHMIWISHGGNEGLYLDYLKASTFELRQAPS
jgi:hypothetical protein